MANLHVTPAVKKGMDDLADLVAEGEPIVKAGASLGMSKGESMSAWRNIKNGLGAQAA